MTENIHPLRFDVEQVGKHVKSSKKRFTWEVSLNSKAHVIVLDFSYISGKVKVTVDRKILLENELPANTSFQYPFTLDGNSLNVIQQGESFELRINNKVFSHLYNQAKTNKQFKKYEDQVKDFKVNESQFQAKKLTLNIGGVGGGMKKKPKTESFENHTWNAFGQQEMSGFPNYFEGQSVSASSSTQKVEQPAQKAPVKNLLEEDSGVNLVQNQQKPQNILDFESQLQKTPQVPVNKTAQEEFSTMQQLFQSMNLGQQPVRQNVVIESNQVDFFSSNDQQSTNNPSKIEQKIDFFGQSSVASNTPEVKKAQQDLNTMKYMFATGIINQNPIISQNQFSTTVNAKSQGSGLQAFNWSASQPVQQPVQPPVQQQQGFNWNPSPVENTGQPEVDSKNFSTLQNLFATNNMGMGQSISNPSVQQQQPVQQPVQQANFSLNTQHFATQQLPTQNFGTGFNLNAQTFGTQNFGDKNSAIQQINFMGLQQKVSLQQSSTGVQQTVQQSVPVTASQPQINMSDFNSMQLLFQTSAGQSPVTQPPVHQSIPTLQQTQQSSPTFQKKTQISTQQFATTSGTVSSPNTMFMNTYSGSTGGNFGFDFNAGSGQQQFSTNVDAGMMKKKTSASGITPVQQPSSNPTDLI